MPRRAVVLGGTGAIGGATAWRLARAGWHVDVTGRDPRAMPPELEAAGCRFHAVGRADAAAVDALVGEGVDLLVDLLAYRAADVRRLLPTMRRARGCVLVSSRAVYVDDAGRHVNGDAPPRFAGPITEDSPTLPPAAEGVDPFSREGYAPSKVAAERAALDSGLPVTVLRPSKVHGRWARNARTRRFVEAMLHGARRVELAVPDAVDHLTAAREAAAVVELVARHPGARVLNVADEGTPSARQIVDAIGTRLGWDGQVVTVDDASGRGAHPWQAVHPIVLDTRAARRLGHVPEGDALTLLADEIDWLASLGAR